MKENDKIYNAADFARYHSGAMPPDEMHALEKAALDDPFLADALEGYAYSKNPGKELDTIKMQLEERKKQKNIFSFSSFTQNTWWKIAAMFIVIAGAGYLFFFINSQKDNSLAIKENQSKKEDTAIISKIKNDTTASEGNMAFEKAPEKEDKNSNLKSSVPSAKSLAPSAEEVSHEEKRIKKEKNLADEKANPMAMSADRMKAAEDVALSDSEQKSFFRSSDTTALVAASSTIYSKDSVNAVAMNRAEPSPQEVVVTGYGKERSNKKTISGKLQGKVSGVQVNKATPYLKEGIEKFNQYIIDNAVPPLDSSGERTKANILLSFTLNKKGTPSNIIVLESSCKACEEEAIRLLKEGPEWVGKQDTRTTVRIQF